MVHEDEGLAVIAQGGWYCAASGWPVADVETRRLGKLPLVAAGELAMSAHRDG